MATKGVARILAIIAVIIVVGGLLLVAYRQREGAASSEAHHRECMTRCTSNDHVSHAACTELCTLGTTSLLAAPSTLPPACEST